MTQPEKDLLLKLVGEIERSRAMLDLLAARAGTGVNRTVADEAHRQVLRDNQPHFDALRKEIEAL